MTAPPKSKAVPPTKENTAYRNTSTGANFSSPKASAQVASKYRLIWSAQIAPIAKLVLLSMANYSDPDGTRIKASVSTFAGHCGLSAKQARRHIHDLQNIGVIVPTATPDRAAHTYRLHFPALVALQSTPAQGSSPTPTHGSSKNAIYSHGRPNLLPPMGDYPNDPDVSQGREGYVPSGRASPALGPNLPIELHKELFDVLVSNGPNTPSRIAALVKRAQELVADGHDINAMAQMAAESGWKRWGLPPLPKAPPAAKKRTTGRKTALLIDPGRNTRAPGRSYDLPGAKP
jgi:hypothetical protein